MTKMFLSTYTYAKWSIRKYAFAKISISDMICRQSTIMCALIRFMRQFRIVNILTIVHGDNVDEARNDT